jgi:hypothetical protein
MRNLVFAMAALLSIGAGTAFAESGDGWDMAHMTSTTPTTIMPTTDRMAPPCSGATFVYGSTSNYVAPSEDTAALQSVTPVAPRVDDSLAGYPGGRHRPAALLL